MLSLRDLNRTLLLRQHLLEGTDPPSLASVRAQAELIHEALPDLPEHLVRERAVASFDLVLCTQVLEHSRDPAQALREITRVLRPGGHAFVTTHGIWPFHPYPVDLWRWTQQGLETIVGDTPGLRLRELVPHRGTASAFALMASYYVDVVTRRRVLAPVRWAAISALNVAGLAGDRVRRLGYPNEDTLIHNFLVVCSRDGASS